MLDWDVLPDEYVADYSDDEYPVTIPEEPWIDLCDPNIGFLSTEEFNQL